jgi:hypothetical protein
MNNLNETAEQKRLNEAREQKVPWKKWPLSLQAPVGRYAGAIDEVL